jgi:hypothetical protein
MRGIHNGRMRSSFESNHLQDKREFKKDGAVECLTIIQS